MNPKTPGKKGRPKAKPGAKTATRQVRRQKLAAAVIAGKPIAEAARETGVSRSWASREINAPQTRALIDQMVDKHAAEIEELVVQGIATIRDLIGPFSTIKYPGEKKAVTLPNEPRVRLLATKRAIELALAGRTKQEGGGSTTTFTWQQFLTIYQERAGAQA